MGVWVIYKKEFTNLPTANSQTNIKQNTDEVFRLIFQEEPNIYCTLRSEIF